MGLKETLSLIEKVANRYYIETPYIVGGLPRDIYLGNDAIKTTDIDITTNSPEVLRLGILTADELNVVFDLSDDGHLTVFTDNFDLDFSSNFVSEGVVKHLDGRFKGLEEAFSRDFTINTLHQELISRKIIDPTESGFRDIENKLIKTPVPAHITLSDDPRRAYRAINLAARYGFDIDEDIKKFVKANLHLFKTSSIKDKYISVKISKSLKENEDLTISLLKEMGLFKFVPLIGDFKRVLIERKLLSEYLVDNSENMQKQAFVSPKSWLDYSEQGSAYQDVNDWWIANHQKIPGSWNPTYQSWTKWYMENYRNDWNHNHKSPEDTLDIMNNEISKNRSTGIRPIFNPTINNDIIPTDYSRREIKNNLKVKVKPGVNIENVTTAVSEFIKELGIVAEEIGAEIPVITSGWRGIEDQVKIMAKNWKNNGGMKGGREYLQRIYGNNYGAQIASIFENSGTDRHGLNLAAQIVLGRPVGSYHITNPGQAIDLRMTKNIRDIIEVIKLKNIFNLKILDESNTAGPHIHVTVKGQNNVTAGIKARKLQIKKFSNV